MRRRYSALLPRGWTIGKRKDRGGGGANKISPARGHCSFRNLRSPTNGVPDWCGSTLSVNCLSITSQILSFRAGKKHIHTANSVQSDVVSFDSALEESLLKVFMWTWHVSRITNGAKRRNSYTGTGFGKKLNISDVGTHLTNNDGETFERGCRVNLPCESICTDFDFLNGSIVSDNRLAFSGLSRVLLLVSIGVDIVALATFLTNWCNWSKFPI